MNFQRYAIYVRFLVAGAVNTLFGLAVYSGAIILGAQTWLALIIGMAAGAAFNFISMGAYVFRDIALKRLPKFTLSYASIYITNLLLLKLLKPWIADPIWAQLVLTAPMAALSYLVLSRMVFTAK